MVYLWSLEVKGSLWDLVFFLLLGFRNEFRQLGLVVNFFICCISLLVYQFIFVVFIVSFRWYKLGSKKNRRKVYFSNLVNMFVFLVEGEMNERFGFLGWEQVILFVGQEFSYVVILYFQFLFFGRDGCVSYEFRFMFVWFSVVRLLFSDLGFGILVVVVVIYLEFYSLQNGFRIVVFLIMFSLGIIKGLQFIQLILSYKFQ